jgi:phytoene synthase
MTSSPSTNAPATLKKNGKTFWFASLFLPPQAASDAADLYAFCRKMDDIADQHNGSNATERLAGVRQELHSRRSDDPVVQGLLRLSVHRGLDLRAAQGLLDVLERDAAEDVCIRDEADLLRYCYGAAGTVGLMMAAVLDAQGAAARLQAIDLGIAMQLTNIARDVREDALMGRCYLPATWLGGQTPKQITELPPAPQTVQQVTHAIAKTIALADDFYAHAALGFPAIPNAARNGIRIAAAVYRHIGVKLMGRGCDYTRGRVVVSLPSKLRIAAGVLGGYSTLERLPAANDPGQLHGALAGLPGVA